jgi:LysR family positive regulator for ilvC
MNHDQLKCFVALGESLSFSRAAEQSNLSPSAFSRIIQRTEEELGVTLCLRSNREVRLTEAGVRFLAYARQNLRQWREFTSELSSDGRELAGELSIFATVTACFSILPGMIAPFRARHPRVSIHLRTGDAADALSAVRSDQVDCSIAPIPESGISDLFIEHLTVTPLVFVAPRSSASAGGGHTPEFLGSLKDFPSTDGWDRWPLILPERGLGRQRIDRWFTSRDIRPRIFAQVAGNEGILAMVSLGLGIGLVPELVVRNSPMAEGLEILPHLEEVPDFAVGVAVRLRNAELPTVRAFIESAREGFGS